MFIHVFSGEGMVPLQPCMPAVTSKLAVHILLECYFVFHFEVEFIKIIKWISFTLCDNDMDFLYH